MLHHVLIVDDEEEIRKIVRLQLSGTRFEILEAEGAEEAIALLKDNALTVDVIVCDVRMPKISGVEAVAYFRQNFPTTPVLVLTGFPDLNLAVDFMKEGVLDYLVKPVEKDKLIEAVENAAKRRKVF
jgi:two-component system chemotaxis response regulator CheY